MTQQPFQAFKLAHDNGKLARIRHMNPVVLSIFAAAGCAVCNGAAAIIQKIGVDRQQRVERFNPQLIQRLLNNPPYLIGIGIDLVGWLLTLYAVHYLPLFLVETVAASNIVITALLERLILKRPIRRRGVVSIGLVLLGLILLGVSASPEQASPIGSLTRLTLILIPIPIAIAAYILTKYHGRRSTVFLAGLSGLAFGMTSIIGRVLPVAHPFWHTFLTLLIPAIAASGLLGTLLFSVALQRAQATTINAVMTVVQVAVPGSVGILLLGDHTRNSGWAGAVTGIILALAGVLLLSSAANHELPS